MIGLRGPLRSGWPMRAARDTTRSSSPEGFGCAPAVSIIHHVLMHRERYGHLSILQGVKHNSAIWREQYDARRTSDVEVLLAADVAEPGWRGHGTGHRTV